MEIQAEARISTRYRIKAEYILNSAFPVQVPAAIQDGTLVPGAQFLGTPLHRDSLTIDRLDAGDGLSFGAGLLYEGAGNELNRPPFAVLNAHITQSLKLFNLTLSATNITNVYSENFTLAGQGVPYPGPDGLVPTDAYVLPARSIMLSLSRRM
jgi:hypothetical protein